MEYQYGDIGVVTQLTKTYKLNDGKGYSRSMVHKVMRGERENADIERIATNYLQAKQDGLNKLMSINKAS